MVHYVEDVLSVYDLPLRTLPLLVALKRAGMLNATQLKEALRVLPETAADVRVDLQALGVLSVKELKRRGKVVPLEIRLTAFGESLAEDAWSMESKLARHPRPVAWRGPKASRARR